MADQRYLEEMQRQRDGTQIEHRSHIALEQIADELHTLNGNLTEVVLALKSGNPTPLAKKS